MYDSASDGSKGDHQLAIPLRGATIMRKIDNERQRIKSVKTDTKENRFQFIIEIRRNPFEFSRDDVELSFTSSSQAIMWEKKLIKGVVHHIRSNWQNSRGIDDSEEGGRVRGGGVAEKLELEQGHCLSEQLAHNYSEHDLSFRLPLTQWRPQQPLLLLLSCQRPIPLHKRAHTHTLLSHLHLVLRQAPDQVKRAEG